MSLALGLPTHPLPTGPGVVGQVREDLLAHARTIALAALGLSVATTGYALYLWAGERFATPPMSYVTSDLPLALQMAMVVAYALVGTTLAIRQPRNAIGWLFLLIGLASSGVPAVDFLVAGVGGQYSAAPASTVALAWLCSAFHLPLIGATVIVVFLRFPDGKPLSGSWGRAGWLALLGALLVGFGQALDPSGLRWYPTLPNPTAAPASFGPAVIGIQVVGLVGVMTALVVATWAMVLRYRRTVPAARHGMAFVGIAVLALAGTGGALMVVRYGLVVGPSTGQLVLVATLLAATAVPIAAAVGMLRYHLFDVELVLAHALVYVPLSGFLAGLYAASVALFTRVFVALTGNSSDVVIVLATLVLAGAFTPLRKVLEDVVDRHFKPAARAGAGPATGGGARAAASTHDPIAELHELEARLADLEHELSGQAQTPGQA